MWKFQIYVVNYWAILQNLTIARVFIDCKNVLFWSGSVELHNYFIIFDREHTCKWGPKNREVIDERSFSDRISKIPFSYESSSNKNASRWKKLFYSTSGSGKYPQKINIQKTGRYIFFLLTVSCSTWLLRTPKCSKILDCPQDSSFRLP